MNPQILDLPSPLADKYQELHYALNDFTTEAAQLHKSVAATDDASRALFTALSRITAYSDQLHMILALMSEDVRVTDAIGAEPAPEFESRELESCFYEWLRASRTGGLLVN